MKYEEIINEIYDQVIQEVNYGEVASYIPELGNIDPDKFGVCLISIDQQSFHAGDWNERFSIQSISKVLSLCLAYREMKEKLWERVDVEPSGTPFNSLLQLEKDEGIPRNPFINAGALVVTDVLIDILENPKADLIKFIRDVSDNSEIDYNPVVAESEKSAGFRNTALINYLKSFDNIRNDVEEVLDFYFCLSSIEMSCQELARTFIFLANQGRKIPSGDQVIGSSQAKRINAIMQTCGFYDEAGEFAYRVGLPGKSGVGGGIAAVHPGKYAIATWSPRLNEKGNSCRGMKFLEVFTTKTHSSIF
jgi:glutaminase